MTIPQTDPVEQPRFDQPNRIQTDKTTIRKPLRLWPGVAAVVLQWLAWFVFPLLFPSAGMYGIFAGLFLGLVVLLWWLFFSRAPWLERIGAIVLMVVAVAATKRLVHESISNGAMGMMLPIFSIPALSLALVVWALVTRNLSTVFRRVGLVVAIVLACAVFMLIRTGGMSGEGRSDLHWRWTKTPEELLLARAGDEPATPIDENANAPATVSATTNAAWPGFRGPNRDGIVRGVRIATNWSQQPPVEIWRKPIGPGWSSFAVQDNRVYTQEQRGNNEVVSCYNITNGKLVWRHNDAARFWESNAGAGPRATPTLSGDRVYTFGATGILNALDARTGSVVWSRNAANDTKTKTPGWGFASSPLVVGDVVIVAAAGALAAYELTTGNPRWYGPTGGRGYSSPHFTTIDGVDQILLLNGDGAISVSPSDGKLLWKHSWKGDSIVQPAVTQEGDVLIGSGSGLGAEIGLLRIVVEQGSSGWTTQERWISIGLKPYFNDFVVHKEHAFGFDGAILSCIDLKNGDQKWEGGRYGHGQVVLLADQDLLLVVSEKGEVALVKAAPDQFVELGRIKAVEGKTWNHPVLVGDVLLVRNDQEMVAFRVAMAAS
jgi:outer membrane protein assembly factor BamB